MRGPDAIVVGRGYNALSIVWTLRAMGVRCTLFCDKRTIAGWSRHCRYVRSPDAACEEGRFQRELHDLCASHRQPPFVVPTNDKWALAVSRAKGTLASVSIPCVAESDVIELLLDKSRFARWGVERGFPTVPSFSFDEVPKIPLESFPVVAKPNTREISSDLGSANTSEPDASIPRLTILRDHLEIRMFLDRHRAKASCFTFQPFIAGDCSCMYTIGVYAVEGGKIVGLFAGRKLRGYPPEYGDCVRGQTWCAPQEILALVREVASSLKLEGIAEFEFKRDERSGRFHLIEINPRSWSWIGITPYCGVGLVRLAYEDLALGARRTWSSLNRDDGEVVYGFTLAELTGSLIYRDNPFDARLGAILLDYVCGRVISGDFRWNDPVVVAVGIATQFVLAVRALKAKRLRGREAEGSKAIVTASRNSKASIAPK